MVSIADSRIEIAGAEPLVLASAATGIVPFIEHHGGDVDRIFGCAGLAPDMAGAPTLSMSLAGFCRLFEESARQTQNDNFGLRFGQQFQPRDLGLWGYAALSSATLGEALCTLVDLLPLHQERSAMQLVGDGVKVLRIRLDNQTALAKIIGAYWIGDI